jgi:TetR/AcrR family transcriptional repressor of nem operon
MATLRIKKILAAFNHNIKFIIDQIKLILTEIDSTLEKRHVLTDFYCIYYKQKINFCGCPILNLGIDTNPKLFDRVKDITIKLRNIISQIIKQGIELKEIKPNINTDLYGGIFLSLIEGSVFASVLLKDDKYLLDMMIHSDSMITNELKIN